MLSVHIFLAIDDDNLCYVPYQGVMRPMTPQAAVPCAKGDEITCKNDIEHTSRVLVWMRHNLSD